MTNWSQSQFGNIKVVHYQVETDEEKYYRVWAK